MKFFVGLASLLLLATPAHATKILDWETCVKEATQYNPDLQTAESNLNSMRALSKAAYNGFFPQISGTLSYTDSNSANSSNLGLNTIGTSSSSSYYSASINGSQNLFSGLQDRARVQQASANEDISVATLVSTKAKVSYDLKSSFANLQFAQNSVTLSTEIIHRREENLRLVQLSFEGGTENKGSYLLSKAYLSEAVFGELQAKQSIDVAQQQLSRVLGNEEATEIEIAGNIPVTEALGDVDYRQVVLNTPDHQQAISQKDYAHAGFSLARAGFLPTLNVVGAFGEQDPDFFPTRSQRWSVNVGLTIPIFNGGRDYYGTRSAMDLSLAALSNVSSVDKQVLANLKLAYTTYYQAIEKLKVDQDFLDAATTRAEIARNKYTNGLQTFEDWDLIENDLISRQKNVLQSLRDKIISQAAWEQAQGKGVIQ